MNAETKMFRTTAAEAREAEIVHNAECDRQTVARIHGVLKTLAGMLFENKITLCDHGCAIDLEALIEGYRPHDAKTVEASARKVAAQWEVERLG